MVSNTTQPDTSTAPKHYFSILKNGVNYCFDPEHILNGQYEDIERILLDCQYHEIAAQFMDTMEQPDLQLEHPKHTKSDEQLKKELEEKKLTEAEYAQIVEDKKYYEFYPEEDKSAFADKARKIQEIFRRRTNLYTDYRRKLHASMIMKGSRQKLIECLLTPEGVEYSADTKKAVKTDLLPKLTQEEVELAISNFLRSRNLYRDVSPSYTI